MAFQCLTLFVLGLSFLELKADRADQLVVGGSPAGRDEFPWIVSINSGRYSCAGTIISEDMILTAAHCATERPENYRITAGIYDLRTRDENAQTVGVAEIRQHEQYNPRTLQNDIALFRLSSPLSMSQYVQVANIATESTGVENKLVVAGWGLTKEKGRPSPIVLKATISKRDPSVCERRYRGYDRNTRICAGDTGKGSCQGDSGGPLHNLSDNTVVGVVSGGGQCAFEGQPGYYSNIGVYASWISNGMNS